MSKEILTKEEYLKLLEILDRKKSNILNSYILPSRNKTQDDDRTNVSFRDENQRAYQS